MTNRVSVRHSREGENPGSLLFLFWMPGQARHDEWYLWFFWMPDQVRHDGWESLFVMPARPNRHSRESGNPGFFRYSSECRVSARHDE